MASKIVKTPCGYEFEQDRYYENRTVGKGRTLKTCVYCGKDIPVGQPHTTHKFYDDDGDWPTYATHDRNPEHGDTLGVGEKSCTFEFKELFHG